MQRPTERLRELVADINAPEIVAHVVPYYKGWQVDGEWLDAWHDAVERELSRLDERCREVRDGD